MARRRNNPPPPSPLPPSPPPAGPSLSWKDHPLAVAAISVSATLVIGGGLVKDLIIPAYTEQLKNQLVDLPRVKEHNEKLQFEIKELQSKLATAHTEKNLALTANTFVPPDPYPVGLNLVRLGDEISKIDRTYKPEQIEKRKKIPYWSVATGHPVFRDVTYFFDSTKAKPTVNTLLIFVALNKYPDPYLKNKLSTVLGEPTGRDEDDRLYWLRDGVVVTLGPGSFAINPASAALMRRLKPK